MFFFGTYVPTELIPSVGLIHHQAIHLFPHHSSVRAYFTVQSVSHSYNGGISTLLWRYDGDLPCLGFSHTRNCKVVQFSGLFYILSRWAT